MTSPSRTETNQAFGEAEKILRKRGEQPRQKQNRLIFLAPDFDVVSRLKDQARVYLAWRSIATDIESGTLIHDLSHLRQSQRNRDGAEQSLTQLIRETWKWLLAPVEDFVKGRPKLNWEAVAISPVAPNLVQAIEAKLREEEWVVYEWSPVHLRKVLSDWYLKGGVTEVSVLKVWQDTCHYLYLPRLLNDDVFREVITRGVETEDYFGFALGKEEDRYQGFCFGRSAIVPLDDSSLLIEREAARSYARMIEESRQAESVASVSTDAAANGGVSAGVSDATSWDAASTIHESSADAEVVGNETALKNHFYGTVSVDPVTAKTQFATLIDEVVEHFTLQLGVDVTISVEIEARTKDGFSESLQRTMKENCNVLKFNTAEFEQD